MLTRLRFGRKDLRCFVRYLSDKPSDNDGKVPDNKAPESRQKMSDSEKIQDLLKKMMTESKISEKEYREKFASAPEIPRKRQQKADEIEVKTEKIEESITKAAGDVAQAIGGDVKQTEAELLSRVLGKINQTSTTLSDLIIGMKVDRSQEKDDVMQKPSRGQQVKRFVEKPGTAAVGETTRYTQRKRTDFVKDSRPPAKRSTPQTTTVSVFSGEPLGIFKTQEPNYGTKLDVWESLQQRELTLATLQPPTNYFQKMVLWTEQGKVWKFPIDNEQGLEEEQSVHFSEHVFLDSHLDGWCPKKGPIRHFMELVCVGLSKNAFYTVQEKKAHILWYKEYFESKKDLLSEVGAWDVKSASPATKQTST